MDGDLYVGDLACGLRQPAQFVLQVLDLLVVLVLAVGCVAKLGLEAGNAALGF